MSDQQSPETPEKCNYTECVLNWLKVVDDWSVGGYKNAFPRLYYVVAGLIVLVILL
jgi:hypothetical protein